MARKTDNIIIPGPRDEKKNRDGDKVFVITEMPAFQAEAWAARLFLAMAKGGIDVPDDIAQMGLRGVAALGLKALAGLAWEDAKPLLDEMMTCVKFMPDPTKPNLLRPVNFGGAEDIEEVSTLFRLRKEVFNLHVNFSDAGGL